MQVLELKVQGVPDIVIKKTLGIRERDYERRLKAIRENKLLHRQAQGACQEIVLRLFALRNVMSQKLESLKERDHFHRVKHAQVILETEREMLHTAKQLGYWPPPADAPLAHEQLEAQTRGSSPAPGGTKQEAEGGLPPLETMNDAELESAIKAELDRA